MDRDVVPVVVVAVVIIAIVLVVWLAIRRSRRPAPLAPEAVFSIGLRRLGESSSHTEDDDLAVITDSNRDNWEGSFWDASDPRSLSKNVILEYVDGQGRSSTRQVALRQFDDTIDLFIGHCFLRDATRTFKFSRIVSCIDAETGEIIPDFKSYCRQEYEKTPDHSLDLLVRDNFDAISVAFYVGKLDGRLTKKENAEIAVFAHKIVGDKRLSGEMLKALFSGWAIPSIQSFRLAVGRLRQSPIDYRIRLVAACEAMIATKTRVTASEKEAIDYLKKRLLDL